MKILKILLKIVKYMVILIIGLILAVVIAVNVSPKPFIYFLNQTSQDEAAVKPHNLKKYQAQVKVQRDVKYTSKFKQNTMDVFINSDNKQRPTIVWAHGGGFIAGDKSGTSYWAMKMAAKGYNVVSINYAVAPDNQYPDQIIQMRDAVKYVAANYQDQLNVKDIVIGGASAGAHIASQLIAAQSNPKLAKIIGFKHLDDVKIVGGLLYCGPYDIKQMVKNKHANTMTKMFINQVGWAYLGDKHWKNSPKGEYVSTVNYVNSKFPPVFITDGNNGSFESQGKELYQGLRKAGVPAKSLFFDQSQKVNHEYQFDLDSKNGKLCFEDTMTFLNEIK